MIDEPSVLPQNPCYAPLRGLIVVRQQMKIATILIISLLLCACVAHVHGREGRDNLLCAEVRAFLASVKPDETRKITLRTFWGAKEDGDSIVLGSKTCEHHDYGPGKRLCAYLLQDSSTEFAGYNAKRILNCLAPRPGISEALDIHSGSFSTTFGSPNRGALVDLELAPDEGHGEMTLLLKADGY